MLQNTHLHTSSNFSNEEIKKKLSPLKRADLKPQYVHHFAPKPSFDDSVATKKDIPQKCVRLAIVAVICLLLIVLLIGILLGYYFSSACIHGMQCGDGSCVWGSEWCDGVKDCPAGQDEANCVRVHGSFFLLQIYWTPAKEWKSVCSHSWSNDQGEASCRSIGYDQGVYVKSGRERAETNNSFLSVKSKPNPQVPILQQLELRNVCPNNSVVTLHCTDCGRTVNSRQTSGSWPWQVSLHAGGSHRCGGVIISPHWILTAAHCMTQISSPGEWTVYGGVVDSLDILFNPAYFVGHIIAHEGFNVQTRQNDIALMRLSEALDSSAQSKLSPVCLPNTGLNVTTSGKYWITQFGPIKNEGSSSLHLMEAQVFLTDAAQCNSSMVYGGRVSEHMLCATPTDADVAVCISDSGSPLVTLRDGLWWLIGDSLWAENCDGQNKPGVYANVTHYLPWIYQQMKKHQKT